jgi:hypothetical protein
MDRRHPWRHGRRTGDTSRHRPVPGARPIRQGVAAKAQADDDKIERWPIRLNATTESFLALDQDWPAAWMLERIPFRWENPNG